jgi:hypothetical protein
VTNNPEVVSAAPNYPAMKRRLAILQMRQKVRALCDATGLGPSFGERLCCALIVGVVPFVVSFVLAFAFREPAGYAALQGVGAFALVALFGILLIGRASDEELENWRVAMAAELPRAEALWREHQRRTHMERIAKRPKEAEAEEVEDVAEVAPVRRAGVGARQTDSPAVVHVHVHEHRMPARSGGTAAVLEVVFGLFFQTFGVGHMFAGHVGTGLFVMFGWWGFLFVNVALAFLTCGFWGYLALIIVPACWFMLMILSPLLASSSAS